jgi:hypothetical protein
MHIFVNFCTKSYQQVYLKRNFSDQDSLVGQIPLRHPWNMIYLIVYIFVFIVILRTKWKAGVFPFLEMQETLGDASTLAKSVSDCWPCHWNQHAHADWRPLCTLSSPYAMGKVVVFYLSTSRTIKKRLVNKRDAAWRRWIDFDLAIASVQLHFSHNV